MTEEKQYDDTNRGALFKPDGNEDQRVSLSGLIDIEGRKVRIAMIKRMSRAEKPYWDVCSCDAFIFTADGEQRVYTKIGAGFKSKSEKENAPAVIGDLTFNGIHKRFALFSGTSERGVKYYSMVLSEPQEQGSTHQIPAHPFDEDIEDEIPF